MQYLKWPPRNIAAFLCHTSGVLLVQYNTSASGATDRNAVGRNNIGVRGGRSHLLSLFPILPLLKSETSIRTSRPPAATLQLPCRCIDGGLLINGVPQGRPLLIGPPLRLTFKGVPCKSGAAERHGLLSGASSRTPYSLSTSPDLRPTRRRSHFADAAVILITPSNSL